jgi:hypothetical protein
VFCLVNQAKTDVSKTEVGRELRRLGLRFLIAWYCLKDKVYF